MIQRGRHTPRAAVPPPAAIPPPPDAVVPPPPPAVAASADASPFAPSVAAGDVYQGPVPGEAPPADVYQGPAPDEAPAGDLYEGPLPGGQPPGDVYRGPLPGEELQGLPGGPIESQGLTARAIVVCLTAAVLSAMAYYAAFALIDVRFKSLIVVMAVLVGVGTRWGVGRTGPDIAILSVVLFSASVLFGDYAVVRHFDEEDIVRFERQHQAAQTIRLDGLYSVEEARRLLGYTSEEWSALSDQDRDEEQRYLREAHQMLLGEEVDPAEFYGYDEAAEARQPITLGFYLTHLLDYFGFRGLLFLVIGGYSVFHLGLTEDDEA